MMCFPCPAEGTKKTAMLFIKTVFRGGKHIRGNGELTVSCHVSVCSGFQHTGSDTRANICTETSRKRLQNHTWHTEGMLIQTRNGDSKLLTEMEQKDPYFEQQGFKAPFTLSVLPLPENKGRLFNIIKAQGAQWKGIWNADKENKKRNASGHFVPLLTM